jgi:flagellar hook-basal body complex protein FliE
MQINTLSNLPGLLPGSSTRPGASGADFGDALRNASGAAGDIFSGGASLENDVASSPAVSGPGFGDTVVQALQNVNNLQAGADDLANKLATGDVQDVHQVMLALNQASMAFDLTAQVRNKVVEAYQEVMRMQV